MEVRPLQVSDADEIVTWFEADPNLWREIGFIRPPARQEVEMALLTRVREELNGQAAIRCVEQQGRLVGMLTINPRVGATGEAHIIVAPHARGQGLAIARAALAIVPSLGIKRLVVAPGPASKPEIWARWVRRLGFTLRYYGEMNCG